LETPDAYLKRMRSDAVKADAEDDSEEEEDYGYYYNINRIQFNHQQFRSFI
jgi:hypothetical protein